MISAVVLTYNEEIILPKCLKALDFADETIVYDSYSSDNTQQIAKKFNAKFIQRKFDNYASQRNAALKEVNNKSRWILMVDADEIVSESLKIEIKNIIKSNSAVNMFRVRRKDMFQGKWLKHSTGYPTWFPRLFKNGKVIVEREINEEYKSLGPVSNLSNHLIHYPFNKGVYWWFHKHNIYSEMEAKKMKEEINQPLEFFSLFTSDSLLRRKFFKRLSYKLPFRPQIIFLIFFIFRKGFLDGYYGYTFCRMRKIYETMIDIKFKLIQRG